MEQSKRALIVTGGEIDKTLLLCVLRKEVFEIVIAVDNGLLPLHLVGKIPNILVGDFDTAKPELIKYYREKKGVEIHEFPPEKDATDTEIAIRLAVKYQMKEVILLGALGIRFDHSIVNIHLLYWMMQQGVHGEIWDTHNRIFLIDHSISIKKEMCFGTYISLLPLTDRVTGVTLKGMKYPLYETILEKGSSLGVSNEIVSQEAQILLENGVLLIIQARD